VAGAPTPTAYASVNDPACVKVAPAFVEEYRPFADELLDPLMASQMSPAPPNEAVSCPGEFAGNVVWVLKVRLHVVPVTVATPINSLPDTESYMIVHAGSDPVGDHLGTDDPVDGGRKCPHTRQGGSGGTRYNRAGRREIDGGPDER
jgi:hypothetical protein